MGIEITPITETTVVGFFIKVFSKNTGEKIRLIASHQMRTLVIWRYFYRNWKPRPVKVKCNQKKMQNNSENFVKLLT